MTADPERRLLARARALADTEDLAEDVTAVLGGGRAARLDPDALRSLAQCAIVLGAHRLAVYRAAGPAHHDDSAFLAAAADADAELAARAAAAARLAQDAAAAADAPAPTRRRPAASWPGPSACRPAGRATAATAPARPRSPRPGPRSPRQPTGRVRQRRDHRAGHAGRAAGAARAWIRQTPGNLGETYEAVYELRARGHTMPRDGDFITGAAS